MTHYSQVPPTVFEQIKRGQKIIEPRLNDMAHRRIKIGDLVVIINRDNREEVVAKVVGLLRYASFEELFAAFPSGHFGDIANSLKEVRSWYPMADEREYGVLGIKLHVLRQK